MYDYFDVTTDTAGHVTIRSSDTTNASEYEIDPEGYVTISWNHAGLGSFTVGPRQKIPSDIQEVIDRTISDLYKEWWETQGT